MKKILSRFLILLLLLTLPTAFPGCTAVSDTSDTSVWESSTSPSDKASDGSDTRPEESSSALNSFESDSEKEAESTNPEPTDLPYTPAEDQLTVHFLDVGQGDSVFIELPNGKTMLIDAAESKYAEKITAYIQKQDCKRIDYLIATHPHADHIGGMQKIVESFEIGTIYMPKASANTKTFEYLLTAISDKGLSIKTAREGVVLLSENALQIRFAAPVGEKYLSLNHYSAVLKITYGATAFLFTGDAELPNEDEITADISADVLKVGHHGSSTSSGEAFLSRVMPKYAVISVGKENSYGHPSKEVIQRLHMLGAEIYRTDEAGNVIISSNGISLSVKTEKDSTLDNTDADANQSETASSETSETQTNPQSEAPPAEYRWILNTGTKKIHSPGCTSIAKIAEKNRAYSNKTLAELEKEGYTACKICNPA